MDGFNKDYCNTPPKIIMPAIKGGLIIAGGLALFNVLMDKPVVGNWLVTYRRTMHKFFHFLGGPKFTDPDLLDAGAMSFVDGITLCGATLIGGRLGIMGRNGKPPPGTEGLDPKNNGPQK